jgi:hypothetical protein
MSIGLPHPEAGYRHPVIDEVPDGYELPVTVYLVELSDETDDVSYGQIGGFFSEAEAGKCLARWSAEADSGRAHINMVPIHRRIEDWQYDR